MTDIIISIVMILLTIICLTAMTVKEANRKAPYGKVFVKEFIDMVDDINTAIIHNSLPCIAVNVHRHSFKVNIKSEVPYNGLQYETIPVYKSYAIYIDDEIVCRCHHIQHGYKDHHFIEFSSKREIDEVIEIIKEAYIEAKEHNHDYMRKLFSKFNSKSFYQDYSSSEE